MNLYTPIKHIGEKLRHVNSHTVYLALLAKENPNINTDFNLVTTIQNDGKKLYVLANAGYYYLSDNFILGEGIANILYSTKNSARAIKYGRQLLKID